MRLISLCPSTTRLVFDLGRGEDLVGITQFCIHPAEGVEGIEKVGGTKNPDIDRILALKPDLVLLNEEENRREDWEALKAAGLACHLSYPRNLDEVETMVEELGKVLTRGDAARRIAMSIKTTRRRIHHSAKKISTSWVYLIWRKPWMTVSADTYISALLTEAGGRNVFAEKEAPYPVVTAEDIAAKKPNLILLSSEPFPFKSRHIDELVSLTELPRRCFQLVNGELLSWHGAHTASGLVYAAELLSDAALT